MSTTGPFAGCRSRSKAKGGEDIAGLIDEHRERTPFGDQAPATDPPTHTAHRSLLPSLATPGRLRENEAFMWTLRDERIDTFVGDGSCEFTDAFAQPFARAGGVRSARRAARGRDRVPEST